MKELVEEVVEKVQLEVLNLSQGERQTILQSLYRIVWELKTHEIIGRGQLTVSSCVSFSVAVCGSKKFWYGSLSGSADPYLCLMDLDADPDPAIFVSDL